MRAANGSATRALTTGVEFVHIKDVAGSIVADDVVDKDPADGDEPGGGGGEAPDPAAWPEVQLAAESVGINW